MLANANQWKFGFKQCEWVKQQQPKWQMKSCVRDSAVKYQRGVRKEKNKIGAGTPGRGQKVKEEVSASNTAYVSGRHRVQLNHTSVLSVKAVIYAGNGCLRHCTFVQTDFVCGVCVCVCPRRISPQPELLQRETDE